MSCCWDQNENDATTVSSKQKFSNFSRRKTKIMLGQHAQNEDYMTIVGTNENHVTPVGAKLK